MKIKDVFPGYVSAAVVKHEMPCGAGRGSSPYEAFHNAWEGDPLSAFGGVIALSEVVDKETAELAAAKRLIEWIIAPGYTGEAMDVMNKTGIRLMKVDPFDKEFKGPKLEIRDVDGGYLVAERYDTKIVSPEFIEVKFGNPTKDDYDAALLNWVACGETKSNCVNVGDNYRVYGIGSGQPSRVDATFMALYKASGRDFEKILGEKKWAKDLNLVAASDAFWPFTDGPEMLAKAGVRGCIYPTGSNRDDEVMGAFDRNGMFVMITRPEPGNKNKTERGFY
jgi:phosphoribosylaminoimidazolecarboxamide formyltransferase/IMP cyclohydrolase